MVRSSAVAENVFKILSETYLPIITNLHLDDHLDIKFHNYVRDFFINQYNDLNFLNSAKGCIQFFNLIPQKKKIRNDRINIKKQIKSYNNTH